MLVWLSDYLMQFNSAFAVLQYITVRGIFSVLTALGVSLLVGPILIRALNANQIGQVIRDDGPQSHLSKAGTPTMGGVLILVGITVSTLLWSDLTNHYVWVLLLVTLAFGAVGWVDDYRKVFRKNAVGLPARWKYFWQSLIGIAAAVVLYKSALGPAETQYILPFFKSVALDLGLFYVVISYFFIVGFSNAVNLTDGLDGLAILPSVLVGGASASSLISRGMSNLRATCRFLMLRVRARWLSLRVVFLAPVLGSFGLILTLHKYSWATLVRSRSALRLARWR